MVLSGFLHRIGGSGNPEARNSDPCFPSDCDSVQVELIFLHSYIQNILSLSLWIELKILSQFITRLLFFVLL